MCFAFAVEKKSSGRPGREPGMTHEGEASIRERFEQAVVGSSPGPATFVGGPGLSFSLADGVRNVRARSLHFTGAVIRAAGERRPAEATEDLTRGP